MPKVARPTTLSVREGTAKHQLGQTTATSILVAAREVLEQQGHTQFTMRNIAARSGLHLANVQYYYPKRDDLVRALMRQTGEHYRELYHSALAQVNEDPVLHFEKFIRILLDDIMNKKTRQFFIQLWALLDGLDEHSGKLLGELYALDIGMLAEIIHAMHPQLDTPIINRRATLIAALVEGLMVVRGSGTRRSLKVRQLLDDACETCLSIARGEL